jgi:hypothetical protein
MNIGEGREIVAARAHALLAKPAELQAFSRSLRAVQAETEQYDITQSTVMVALGFWKIWSVD